MKKFKNIVAGLMVAPFFASSVFAVDMNSFVPVRETAYNYNATVSWDERLELLQLQLLKVQFT